MNYTGNLIVGRTRDTTTDFDMAAVWEIPGSAVTAYGSVNANEHAFATQTSSDGLVLGGVCHTSSDYSRACIWYRPQKGMRLTPPISYETSYVAAMSDDGTVLAGYTSADTSAFRWTQGGGWVTLVPPSGGEAAAHAITADGSVVFGSGDGSVVRWVGAARTDEAIGSMFLVEAASVNGSVLVGHTGSGGTQNARIWDATNGSRAAPPQRGSISKAALSWGLAATMAIGRTAPSTRASSPPDGQRSMWMKPCSAIVQGAGYGK